MKIKSYILLLALIAGNFACKKTEENPLATKKTELQKLVGEKSVLDTKIKTLKEEISKLEPIKIEKVKNVTASPIITDNLKHYVEATGRLDAENNVFVSPRMGGALTNVYVKEGQYVKKGQTIATIDNSVMKNSLQEIETRLETARIMFDKQKNLWDQKIGTEVQFIQAKATVDGLEKSLATLKSQNAMNVVTAPISGYIDEVRFKAGEVASPGYGIARIVNFNKMKVVAKVPDTYAGTISKGDLVTIEFPDLGKSITSKLSFVSQTIDPSTRSFSVEASVPSDKKFKPNLTAILKINDQSSNATIVVPRNIIQRTEKGDIVFVSVTKGDKKIATSRVVETGLVSNDKIEIKSGINPGDIVITEGYQELVDGTLINY